MVMFTPARLARPRPPAFGICLRFHQASEFVMTSNRRTPELTQTLDSRRRDLLGAAGAGLAAGALSGVFPGASLPAATDSWLAAPARNYPSMQSRSNDLSKLSSSCERSK